MRALIANLSATLLVLGATAAGAAPAAPAAKYVPAAKPAPAATDPRLWLEETQGARAMEWVKHENAECKRRLASSPEFAVMKARFLSILNAETRIPYVSKIGPYYYNTWRDAKHPRGVWRRTTLAEYRRDTPAWETVLDLDSLAAAEHENWFWNAIKPLPHDPTRCLIFLAPGGTDAKIVREFDLTTKAFVPDGFQVPSSKADVEWIDRDHLFVEPGYDSTYMTTSGYSRVVKEWTRGTPLASAPIVFEGRADDIAVGAFHVPTKGHERDIVQRYITRLDIEFDVRRGGTWVKIEKPGDASVDFFDEWILIRPQTDWTVGGKTYSAGALLAAKLDAFLAGDRTLDVLFEPRPRASLAMYDMAKSAIFTVEMENVRSRAYVVRREGDHWTRTEVPGQPEFGSVQVTPVDDDENDDYWMITSDFLTPATLRMGTAGGPAAETLKQSPAFFDARGLTVTQHEVASKDGTSIPYFEIAPAGLKHDGTAPTILYGYGGFELSQVPAYSAINGSGWLERGGVYVLANIRGGGEFGPSWHLAAVKEKKPRSYEDFMAVAEDLVRRGVTSPKHLGCWGGSNGGLLTGNMLTKRPELFGAVVCQSPMLDLRRFTKLLKGPSWRDEFGDPDDPKQWAFMRTFSPYHNIKRGVKYPPALFTSSTLDDRLHPMHARKMVDALHDAGHEAFYFENIEGGHSGASTPDERAFVSALTYSFFARNLGAPRPAAAASPPSSVGAP